jgi:diacylglycerol kinase family enzyme
VAVRNVAIFARALCLPKAARMVRTHPNRPLARCGRNDVPGVTILPHLHILLNGRSGTANTDADALKAKLEAAGYTAEIDANQDNAFANRLRAARRSRADILVAAGGDGTATALAEVAAETDRPLAILPMGTANLLAKDLALPLDHDAWIAALPGFAERRIDLGRVNDRVFLHKVVVGFVPAIAAGREKIRGETALTARIAFLSYAARRILRSKRIALELTRDNEPPHIDRVQAVAISNNSYDEAFGAVFSRSALDAGHLGIYKLHSVTLMKAIGLAAGVVMGRWQDDAALTIETAEQVVIRSRHKLLKVMLDGEVENMQSPLNFRIEKQALRVLAPPVAEAVAEPAEQDALA